MIGRCAISGTGKIVLIALVFLSIVVALANLDLGGGMALWSHLRHGFRGHCCGIEVKVPLKYWATEGRPDYLSLLSAPGYLRTRLFHSPHAMILVSRNSPPLDEEHIRHANERLIGPWTKDGGYHLVGTKAIRVSGNSMNCVELYTEHFRVFGPDYDVWCTGQDITANFSGSPALLSEFYTILEGAKPTIEFSVIRKQ